MVAAVVLGFAGRSPAAEGDAGMQKATFGAGCFWGVQATFSQV